MRLPMEDILRDVEVQVEGNQLKLTGQLNLSVEMSEEREQVPDELEEEVEQTGQELKRLLYRLLLERADQHEVLRVREGKRGQGIQQRGTRPLSFHTRFGLVPVERKRIMHRADGSTEVPSAKAWNTPQHDDLTRGLRHAVCDELQDRTVRRTCQALSERAGQADFLNDATALDILHDEGARLIDAQRKRAEEILKDDCVALHRLVPPERTAAPRKSVCPCREGADHALTEDQVIEALRIAVGFLTGWSSNRMK